MLFGGRRAGVVPLVNEAFSWQHGVFLGSIMSSETTTAAAGKVGVLRRDPMAMLPFCGYNMGEYFAHWLKIGAKADPSKLPRIYYVNWFRKSAEGTFLWPGYSENSRVLKWIFQRVAGKVQAQETPIGCLPKASDIDVAGLTIPAGNLQELLRVDRQGWLAEVPLIKEHYARFGDSLPHALHDELAALEQRLRS
jgi:phosphoenolpyruvate carboxykinase (GTP)